MPNYYSTIRAAPGREEDAARNIYKGGLSKAHIETLSCGLFYLGGSKMKVTRNYESTQKGGGKRGKITTFTDNSRRRLQGLIAEISTKEVPIFVTLTMPDEYFEERKNSKDLQYKKNKFEKRMYRKFPNIGWIWKKEFEPRKTGKYIGKTFPHLHLLIYGGNYEDLLKFISVAWWEVCGKLSSEHLAAGTRVEKMRNNKQGSIYITKYISKQIENDGENFYTGRIWGVIHPENIPFVKAILCPLTEKEAVTLIRYMRKFAALHGKDYKALTLFCNPDYWYTRLPDILYPK